MDGLLVAILIVVVLYGIYGPLTDAYVRYVDTAVLRRGDRKAIALTFDDGPDPRYTPRVLDILRDEGIEAAFFVVGHRAAKYPELLGRIEAEGHLVATHTYSHHHAYLTSPWRAWREVTAGVDEVESVTRRRPAWFRPPWGATKLAMRLAVAASQQRLVLWTVTGEDWDQEQTPRSIAAGVNSQLKPGAIVVLHDAGGSPGAPENTIAALPDIIGRAQEEGFRWVRLDQLSGDC
jgi:peptidoglycan/xylan/chitin deacetylase (PgdA/CDA1 family)